MFGSPRDFEELPVVLRALPLGLAAFGKFKSRVSALARDAVPKACRPRGRAGARNHAGIDPLRDQRSLVFGKRAEQAD